MTPTHQEPWNPGAMFLSSFKAETAERRKRELKEPLEERCITNAAVLPDLRLLPASAPASALQTSSKGELLTKESPLLIHGHSMKECQSIYHSVADPGVGPQDKAASEGGVSRSQLRVAMQLEGQLSVTETFSTPKSSAPHTEVDFSGEPMSEMKR
ncbi:hypothetical protein AOLI_G00190610 [Acnodon oligacanthus]